MTNAPRKPKSGARRRLVLRWIRRLIAALVVLAGAGLIVKAWMPKPIAVDFATAERGPMRVTVDESGVARVKDRYIVSSPLSGRLARIELHSGDSVEVDAVLARIAPLAPPLLDARTKEGAKARVAASAAAQAQSAAQIERAKATLEFAKKEVQRTKSLVNDGALPRRELDQVLLSERTASAELDSAKFGARVVANELKMARAALGQLTAPASEREQLEVTAPVAGRVLKVLQENEGVVQAGTPLLEVGDPAALELVVDVLTSDAVHVAVGASATVDRWGGDQMNARVRLIEPSAFTRLSSLGVEEQRVNVLIDLDAPKKMWASLGDGYRVEAHIEIWQADDVLKVPASSVFRHGAGWALFVNDVGVARLREVQVGKRSGNHVQLTGGVEEGAQVVLHPDDRVKDGVQVISR